MLVILAVLLGIAIGLVRKGKLSGLFEERPRLWIFILLGLLMQLGLHLLFYTGLEFSLIAVVNFISYVLMIVPLVFSFKNIWLAIQGIGFFVNFLVIFLNGGLMPVSSNVLSGASAALAASINNGSNAVYMLMDTAATKLWFLGNVVCIPKIGAVTSLYGAVPGISFGTLMILIGVVGWTQGAMARHTARPQSFFDNDANSFDGEHHDASDQNSKSMLFNDDNEDEDDAEFFRMGKAILGDQTSGRNQDLTDEEMKYLEEEAITEMTEVIPKLTPEMIAKICKNELKTSEFLSDEDISRGETKVFMALKNLDERKAEEMAGREISNRVMETEIFERDQKIKSDELEEQWWDDAQLDDEDVYVPHWDWDKQNRSDVSFDMTPENEDAEQDNYFSDIRESDLFEDVTVTEEPEVSDGSAQEIGDEPEQIIREQTANPYSTLFNRKEKKSSRGRSFDEMRNIWHQTLESDRRRQGKSLHDERSSSGTPEKTVPRTEEDSTTQKQPEQPVQVSKYEKDRDALAEQWDQSRKMPKLTGLTPAKSTERVDSKEILRQTLSRKSEEKMVEAFVAMERKRAGYDKVELDIDGQTVLFWRKKKEQQ